MTITGRPLRSFVVVAREGWTPEKDFKRWMALALDFNPRAKASKKSLPKKSNARTLVPARRKK